MPETPKPAPSFVPDAAPSFVPDSQGVELSPFPVDSYINDKTKHLPPEEQTKARDGMTSTMYSLAKPWMDMGYSAMSSFNRGIANFLVEGDLVNRWFAHKGVSNYSDIDMRLAKEFEADADMWKEKLPKEGVGALDKAYRFVGDMAGGVVPSISQFTMEVASGLTIPAISGAQEAFEHDTDPFIGGITEAAKTGSLALLFGMIGPLKSWMKAGILGTTFGAEGALQAPEGEKTEGFAKGAATGGVLGIMTPSGKYGLRDIYPEIFDSVPKTFKGWEAPKAQAEVGLRPAVRDEAQTLEGEKGQSHADVDADAGQKGPEAQSGFTTPDGEFLDREQAKGWVKENEPEVYDKWVETMGGDEAAEFHSTDYWDAKERLDEQKRDPALSDLTDRLRGLTPDSSLNDRVSLSQQLKQIYTGAESGVRNALSSMRSTTAAVWDWYKRPPQWKGTRAMIDRYKGASQVSGWKIEEFSKAIKKTYNDRTQRAMTAYVQAGGDGTTLSKWADATENPELKEKYTDALALTDEQKQFVQDYRNDMEAGADRAIDAGILDHVLENYVPQAWEKENAFGRGLVAESNAGVLQKNPFFAKKRIFESYFDGEQAGHSPKDARIGYLASIWHKANDEALNTRAFLRELTTKKASDGRPLAITSGVGQPLPKEVKPSEGWLINPDAVSYKKSTPDPETGETMRTSVDVSDYSNAGIDHPAMRKWKWVSSDNEGNPIFVQGDLVLHPEAYSDTKAFLSTSAVRKLAIGRGALRLSSELKGTMLGFFSPFHQVHLGVTSAFHGKNPFSPPTIDIDQPLTRDLINHGLILYEGKGMAQWSEGLRGPGLIRFIPKVGEYSERYTEYLFGLNGYIARLKNYVAQTVYEKNTARYPELNRDQVLVLTADQSNAMFGGVNWKGMAQNKTFQDLFRLGALAPDFLTARTMQVGQALRPYGREQLAALAIRGGIGQYVAAKTIEGIMAYVDPDKNEVHWDRPFSVTIDGKEYSLRSETGDLYHMIKDPRGYVYNRLNPAIVKPAIEAITGRDAFGRKRDAVEQGKDWATSAVPMAGQGFFTKQDYDLYQSVLASIGVSSWVARTEAEKVARDIAAEKSKAEPPGATRERLQNRGQIKKDFAKSGDINPIRKGLAEGQITLKDAEWILNRSIKGDLPSMMQQFSVSDSLKVWDKATQEEKAELQPMMIMKWLTWQKNSTPAERAEFKEEMNAVMKWKPTRELKKKRFSIRASQ